MNRTRRPRMERKLKDLESKVLENEIDLPEDWVMSGILVDQQQT